MRSATDPMAVVRQYFDAFNGGDAKGTAAAFAVPGSILDGLAPHVWHGPTATEDWYRDVLVAGVTRTGSRLRRLTRSSRIALRKLPAGWRIAAWAWAKGSAQIA